MINSVSETAAVRPTARAAATPASAEGGFAAELDKQTKNAAKKTTAEPKDAKKVSAPKLERTDPVEGHMYAEITAGPRNGMYLNTSGNERHGKAFLIVERAGRTFHVYGTGADRAVFEVKDEHKTPAATKPATPAPAATKPATPAPAATTPAPAMTNAATQTPVAASTPAVATTPAAATTITPR